MRYLLYQKNGKKELFEATLARHSTKLMNTPPENAKQNKQQKQNKTKPLQIQAVTNPRQKNILKEVRGEGNLSCFVEQQR